MQDGNHLERIGALLRAVSTRIEAYKYFDMWTMQLERSVQIIDFWRLAAVFVAVFM
jgi:hypothetical protein